MELQEEGKGQVDRMSRLDQVLAGKFVNKPQRVACCEGHYRNGNVSTRALVEGGTMPWEGNPRQPKMDAFLTSALV